MNRLSPVGAPGPCRGGRWSKLGRAVVIAAGLSFAGCATPDPESLSSFREGLSAVQKESHAVFLEVNRAARKTQLDRAETLPMIRESDVAPALAPAAIAEWNRALEALAAYASSLEILSSSGDGADVEASVGKLGVRIQALVPAAPKATDELAKAVGRLGNLLTQAVAGAVARDVMRDADPDVRDVLTRLADMIGRDTAGGGVRTTVWANWTLLADGTRAAFPGAEAAKKRRVAETYAEQLEKRDAADAALAALRQSLLDLADAHTAASQGRAADAGRMVALLREQVAYASKLLKSARGADEGGAK